MFIDSYKDGAIHQLQIDGTALRVFNLPTVSMSSRKTRAILINEGTQLFATAARYLVLFDVATATNVYTYEDDRTEEFLQVAASPCESLALVVRAGENKPGRIDSSVTHPLCEATGTSRMALKLRPRFCDTPEEKKAITHARKSVCNT